jgi:hypothetical protein
MSVGTLQHLRPVCGPLPTSKQEMVHGLSCLSTCTLICLGGVDSKEISIESCHARAELSQHACFFP